MNKISEYKFQPPKKINNVRVDYVETSIAKFRGKMWITLFPLDEKVESLWEFCLDDGKLIKTR